MELLWASCVLLVSVCVAAAVAQDHTATFPVAGYAAAGHPTNQNWTAYIHDPATSVWEAAVFDVACNTNAWVTHVDGSMNGAGILHDMTLSESVVQLARSYGWTLTARLRAPEIPEGPTIGVDIQEQSFYLSLYSADTEHTRLLAATNFSQMWPGPPFVGEWANTAARFTEYHTYSLTHDPSAQTAVVAVDNSVVLTNYRGASWGSAPGGRVLWGAGGTYVSDETYWLSVDFSVHVPRPTITGLAPGGSNTVELQWFARSNLVYIVEQSPSLSLTDWTPATGVVTGHNAEISLQPQCVVSNSHFFRLRMWPRE